MQSNNKKGFSLKKSQSNQSLNRSYAGSPSLKGKKEELNEGSSSESGHIQELQESGSNDTFYANEKMTSPPNEK